MRTRVTGAAGQIGPAVAGDTRMDGICRTGVRWSTAQSPKRCPREHHGHGIAE
jgi:hypothetical protein